MSTIFITIGIFFIAITLIGVIRNEIVFKIRTKALSYVSEAASADIKNHLNWTVRYEKFDSYGTYDEQMLSIKKWKFDQFYPGLIQYCHVYNPNESEEDNESI